MKSDNWQPYEWRVQGFQTSNIITYHVLSSWSLKLGQIGPLGSRSAWVLSISASSCNNCKAPGFHPHCPPFINPERELCPGYTPDKWEHITGVSLDPIWTAQCQICSHLSRWVFGAGWAPEQSPAWPRVQVLDHCHNPGCHWQLSIWEPWPPHSKMCQMSEALIIYACSWD